MHWQHSRELRRTMRSINYKDDIIRIYEYEDAKQLIIRLAKTYSGDLTSIATKGRGRNVVEYYNYACSFDIETTTIKPGQLDYPEDPEAAPVAFPYLFQWNIYGEVLMCRTYNQALQIFSWLIDYFRLAVNRKMIIFIHNLGYEWHFFQGIWEIDSERCFAIDERHPVTIYTKDGFIFRDSYKMTNLSLAALSKDWSRKWIKDKDIMDYSELRTPYTELDDNTYIYSALDVLSLSDAIEAFLQARNERIWTKCPTSTSFIRKALKKDIGVGAKKRTKEQQAYFDYLEKQKISIDLYELELRAARGGNTHANRFFTGKYIENCGHGDICSSYPTEMVTKPEFPIGSWHKMDIGSGPEDVKMLEEGGYCCLFDIVLIGARLKKGVTVPYISLSKMAIVEGYGMKYTDNGRYIGGLKAIKLSIFGIEWPIIERQYSFDNAVIIKGYYARKGYLPDIVRRFVVDLYRKKTELKGIPEKAIEYALAKTYVNGVFGMSFMKIRLDNYIVTDDGIYLSEASDPAEELKKYQDSISYFIPYVVGCLIAALGRVHLQAMIDCCGDNFLYCDTDSVFFSEPEKIWPRLIAMDNKDAEERRKCGLPICFDDIKGRPHEMGRIEDEGSCGFKSFGAKKYITVEDGKLTCTIAGVPKKAGSALIGTPERFQLGFNFKGADTGKNCLWYNPPLGYDLHDSEGRTIPIHYNVAMLPCDYLLSMSSDYTECLSIEGNFHWQFKEADKYGINEEDL